MKVTVQGFSLFSSERYLIIRLYLFHTIANRNFCIRISDDCVSVAVTAERSNSIQSKYGYIRTCEKYLQYFVTQFEFRIGDAQRENSNKRTILVRLSHLTKFCCVVDVKYLLRVTFLNQLLSKKKAHIFGDPFAAPIQFLPIACLVCLRNQISSTTCALRRMKKSFWIPTCCENIRT